MPTPNKRKNPVNQSMQPPRKQLNSPYSKKYTEEYYALHKKPPQLRTSSQLPARGGPLYNPMDEPGWVNGPENLDNVRLSVENPFKGKQNIWNRPQQSRSGAR